MHCIRFKTVQQDIFVNFQQTIFKTNRGILSNIFNFSWQCKLGLNRSVEAIDRDHKIAVPAFSQRQVKGGKIPGANTGVSFEDLYLDISFN